MNDKHLLNGSALRPYWGTILKVVLPSLLAVFLFIVALFGIVLPASEKNLMEQKKKAIATLTQTAWSILAHHEQLARSGQVTVEQAKEHSIKEIRELRYGPEGKDYFWINDLHPRMVMHPYRADLEGGEIASFTDPSGKHLFSDFVSVAKSDGAGFVPYLWQWKDEPDRVVPKLSYVKLFEPWGWIIGTGIYLDDITAEIDRATKKALYISMGVLALVVLLSAYIIHHGVREMNLRRYAEEALREHHEQLEELVRQRTAELTKALAQVKTLTGLLPICASCKNIRDDRGYWKQIEVYIKEHSNAEFSHGICPDCAARLYPEIFPEKQT